MAASVAAPLERQFGQIQGVTQMTSMNTQNGTSITLQFDLNRNIDSAAQDVQAAITVASKTLPAQMSTPPSYKKVNPADSPITMLTAQSDTLPLYVVDDYVDNYLAQKIAQVPGVAQARRRVHARPDDCARGAGHIAVPAQFLGDVHSGHHGAAGVARIVRPIYLARLQIWVQGRKIQYAPGAAEEPIHIVAAE